MKVAQSYPECHKDNIRVPSVATSGYHTECSSRRDGVGESDYAYVWDGPTTTSCMAELKDRTMPRYDATFPRTTSSPHHPNTGTLRGIAGKYSSFKRPEKVPQYFELDPDVVTHGGVLLATPGGQTVTVAKCCHFTPSCSECEKSVFDPVKSVHQSHSSPACI